MKEEILKQYWKLKQEGKSQREACVILDIARSTLQGWIKDEVEEEQASYVPKILFFDNNKSLTTDVVKINTKKQGGGSTHLFIGDTQCKASVDLSYTSWIGNYIAKKKPDVIIHAGDHWDFPSLSSYDKGKKAMEGRRVLDDINAGIVGMNNILAPVKHAQELDPDWTPRMVFLTGNHCERLTRYVNDTPELEGFLSFDNLRLKEMGWEVYDFLEVANIDGIAYSHYFANPLTGKPYTGTVTNMLKTIGTSFTMGHRQVLDTATRFLHNGTQQWGCICGACYPHDEEYKSPQGNHHFRGLIVKHNVKNGSYDPMFVSLDYMRKLYDKR